MNSSGAPPSYMSRCWAIRSTSSTTIIAGWRERAIEHACLIADSASPLSCTMVVSVSSPTRYRTVWVLPDARRAVEQQAALEVLARRPQRVPVPGDADDLPAYVLERLAGRISSPAASGSRWWKRRIELCMWPNMARPNETTWPR